MIRDAITHKDWIGRWADYLYRFWELSIRDWKGETPLGRMEWLDPCQDVLDIGCGAGFAMDELKAKGKLAIGIDITPENVDLAREKGHSVGVQDMHSLPFADSSFDGAMMWDVFEHALAPLIVLFECNRVLRPQGRLLIYIPPEHWDEHPVHVIIYTDRQIEMLFKKSGFKLDAIVQDSNHGKQYHAIKL